MGRIVKPSSSALTRHRLPTSRVMLGRLARHGHDDDPALGRNIYSRVASRLGQEIIAGVYPPGTLLPIAADMCARFSVSRTALREAYSILSAKALIVARPKIGTRVRPKSEWNLLDSEVLAWHLQATPNEHFIDDLFVLQADGRAGCRRARRLAPLERDDRPDRRGLWADGAVQERRGRPRSAPISISTWRSSRRAAIASSPPSAA